MGSGINKALELDGSGVRNPFASTTMSSRGVSVSRDICSEEFVEVSHAPDEQREDMSPSRATSREDDLEDFPDERPLEEPEPPLDVVDDAPPPAPLSTRPARPSLSRIWLAGHGRCGELVGAVQPLKGGDVLTDPSGFCTCSHTSS